MATQQSMQSYSLPQNWLAVELGTVCSILPGYGFPKRYQGRLEGKVPFFKVRDISRTVMSGQNRMVDAEHYISDEECNELKATPLPAGTVVFAKIGEAIKLNRRAILGQDSLIDNNVMGLYAPTSSLAERFLYYWMLTVSFDEVSRATAVPSIRKSDVERLSFPLPPLNEQRRIVEKIEELFTKLDAGVRSLEQTRALLKSYRRSVLKAAAEGELSREWREAHKYELESASELLERILQERQEMFAGNLYKKSASPEISKLPVLPDVWTWARMQDISHALGGFAFKSRNYSDTGYQIVKIGNVKSGELNLAERPSYIEDVDPETVEKYALQPDDIAVSLTGSRGKRDYGFVALIRQQQNLLLNQRVARLRFSKMLNAQYCALALQGDHFQNQFFHYETGNVGQGNVGMKAVKETYIPLAPIREQRFIVEEVERRLSVVAKLECLAKPAGE